MSMFDKNTELTSGSSDEMSNLDIYLGLTTDERIFIPGVYENGLITICGSSSYKSYLMESWDIFKPKKIIPIALTAWGDLIYVEAGSQVTQMFFMQKHKGIEIDISPHEFIVYILRNEEEGEEFLQTSKFRRVLNKCGPLTYGNCYIHEPWQLWNVSESIGNWTMGDNSVYIDLVGQTWPQRDKALEAMKKAGKEGRAPKIKVSISE